MSSNSAHARHGDSEDDKLMGDCTNLLTMVDKSLDANEDAQWFKAISEISRFGRRLNVDKDVIYTGSITLGSMRSAENCDEDLSQSSASLKISVTDRSKDESPEITFRLIAGEESEGTPIEIVGEPSELEGMLDEIHDSSYPIDTDDSGSEQDNASEVLKDGHSER